MIDICALYIRLSSEDKNLDASKACSVSVENQRMHLRYFLMNHPEIEYGEIREFIDDGYTGTNSDRPAFTEMIQLVKYGQVECIIVKDFSRFGRNYIEVGSYLEQIFPYLGVRFISVDDNYDSEKNKGDVPGLDVGFKNIIHDYYSKDLSSKVIQTKRNLARKGLFLGSIPPFGYIRSPDDRHQLIVDKESSKIVRKIFAYALDGVGLGEIARILNREEAETPGERLNRLGIRKKKSGGAENGKLKWTTATVRDILCNQIVTGSVVNHRVERKEMGRAELKRVNKSEQIIVPDMHEAIIEKEIFDQIQRGIVKSQHGKRKIRKYPLSGLLKCGYCGKNLIKEGGAKKENAVYVCQYARVDNDINHKRICVKEGVMIKTLVNLINILMQLCDPPIKTSVQDCKSERNNKESGEINGFGKVTKSIPEQDSVEKRMLSDAYDKYVRGCVSKETFLKWKREIHLQCQKEYEKDVLTESNKKLYVRGVRDNWGKIEESEVTKEVLKDFIKEIRVFSGGRVEIIWRFGDEFAGDHID